MIRMPKFFGYVPAERQAGVKTLYECRPKAKTGEHGKGGKASLDKFYLKATGKKLEPRHQGSTPSCVGHGTAGALDILRAVRIGGIGLKETFDYRADATSIYAGSRYEIGYKKHGSRGMLRGGGSSVPYAVELLKDYGCLYMKNYGDGYDLSEFDQKRCNSWGQKGIPDDLESFARERTLVGSLYIESYEEAIAALSYGFPIVFGSSQGFDGQNERDSEGFLRPRGTWHHCQYLFGYDDNSRRPYVKCHNSWGSKWLGGPLLDDDPEGSYRIEKDVIAKMIRNGEFIALTDMVM